MAICQRTLFANTVLHLQVRGKRSCSWKHGITWWDKNVFFIKSHKAAPIVVEKPACAGILKNGIDGIDGISQVFSGIKENTASNCNEQRACAAIH